MICVNCGAVVPDGSTVCANCGAALNSQTDLRQPYQPTDGASSGHIDPSTEKAVFITGLLALILGLETGIGGIICGIINRVKVGQAKKAVRCFRARQRPAIHWASSA